MRRGFTLVEILIVVIVIAVLAALALPYYGKTKAKNDAKQAITYLRAIRLAELVYYAKNGVSLACANDAAIRAIGPEITNGSYSYDVTAPSATTFLARARKGAAPADCAAADTLCIDQAGAWTGASIYKPTV